jgi:iron complex transport system substrate-binding protein
MKALVSRFCLVVVLFLVFGFPWVHARSGQSGGVSIADSLGRRIDLPRAPSRIAVIGRDAFFLTSVLYQFPGSAARIVAAGGASQDVGEFCRLIDPQFDKRTVLGPLAGPEHVAATRPDVVLMGTFNVPMRRSLEALGIPVVCIEAETGPADFFRILQVAGMLLGDVQRARTIREWYERRLDQIGGGLGQNGRVRPRVLLLMHTIRDGQTAFNVPAAEWLQTKLVRLAGGDPVWEIASPGMLKAKVGLEQVAAWDPDWIFLASYSTPADILAGQLAADRQWQLLRAMRSHRVQVLPAGLFRWDQPDARWVLGLQWLARTLDPASFAGLDLDGESRAFYSDLYGVDSRRVVPRLQSQLGTTRPR